MLPERQFIERLRKQAGRVRRRELILGIGDDCALLHLPKDRQLLVTTDLCVEGIHFRREWHSAHCVGHRCLARGLSDIAAMGAEPMACFVSMAAPADLPQKWVDDFLRGLLELSHQHHVPLAGGDTSSAEKILADVVVLGAIPPGKALLRSGAQPGDCVFVTGELGGSAGVLKKLYSGDRIRASRTNRHFYPEARLDVARHVREKGLATAAIDISDGLSVDLSHLCQESGVSAFIESRAIPVEKTATLEMALHGGDDYELLFTTRAGTRVPPKIKGVRVTMIGRILSKSAGPQVEILDPSGSTRPLAPEGWQHFARS